MPQFDLNLQIETLIGIGATVLRVTAILVVAFVVTKIISRWLPRLNARLLRAMNKSGGAHQIELEKRARTLSNLLARTLSIVVWVMAVLMGVKELGFDIGPILAGAGILGLAIGFGAQSLVKDVISGIFLLLENQIRVGDVAVVNGQGGLVEELNLRTTVLRSLDGGVHTFPNGSIEKVANMTREFSCYVFDIGVAYKEDVDEVIRALQVLSEEMMNDLEFAPLILEPMEVFGLDKMDDSALVIKARVKTLPLKQFVVGREFNRRIKKRFDELGIEIPFPQRSLHMETDLSELLTPNKGQIRQIVKEVLVELKQSEQRELEHTRSN